MTAECRLLGGPLAYAIQFALGVAAIGSLVLKRHFERPQRHWKIWALDVGKQLVGGLMVHLMNILVSTILGSNGDECAWYFVNFFVDCTLGVAVVFFVHRGICRLAERQWGKGTPLSHIGFYGDPPTISEWAHQMCAYAAALVVNKAFVCALLIVFRSPVARFGDFLFGPLQNSPNIELIVVMVLCPWLLTSFQFLVFDAILKAPSHNGGLLVGEDVGANPVYANWDGVSSIRHRSDVLHGSC